MEEKDYYLCFALVPGVGPKRFQALIRSFGSAKKAWNGSFEEFNKVGINHKTYDNFVKFREVFNIKSYFKKLEEKKTSFIAQNDRQFPSLLKKIESPPIGLFLKGEFKGINWDRIIAVVGNRKMTGYGKEVTRKLVSDLVFSGFTIVSGLALGIDAVSHRAVIESSGKTIAVLGCGVDYCYPVEHEKLYESILDKNGAIISEYPLLQKPSKGTFPARNRIISGISQAVLVTEAGAGSGALITAEYAKEQNKPIFAVPGPITSSQSIGTTKLLKEGAILIQDAEDILTFFNFKKTKPMDISNFNLSIEEKLVFEALRIEKMNIDDLAKKTGIKVTKLNILLSSLEMQGIVENFGGEFGINGY